MSRLIAVAGWFVDWDGSEPISTVWTDADARHCTYWMWRHRLNRWFVCSWKGHVWVAVHCSIQAHNDCWRCWTKRGEHR